MERDAHAGQPAHSVVDSARAHVGGRASKRVAVQARRPAVSWGGGVVAFSRGAAPGSQYVAEPIYALGYYKRGQSPQGRPVLAVFENRACGTRARPRFGRLWDECDMLALRFRTIVYISAHYNPQCVALERYVRPLLGMRRIRANPEEA